METDQIGRKVTLPVDPKRVVALAPSITEIIFALNQQHRLVGATRFSDHPPAARSLPRVGSYVHLDLERIVSLQPDLCIAVKDGNPKHIAVQLEGFGIPVYAVDPRNIAAVLETILAIGRLLDTGDRAAEMVAALKERIARTAQIIAGATTRPGVFFQIGVSPIVSVGTGTFIHELIVSAGGRNLAEGPVPYPRFSKEQVLALAPDVLIITSMARDRTFDDAVRDWRQFETMPAVINGRILVVDSNLFDRASHRLIDALEHLARLIHPELFEAAR
jgi:iron complex transport system substrate-binding protein